MSSGGREDESGYALFDFDGTLTRHDTFLPFLIRVGGAWAIPKAIWRAIRHRPRPGISWREHLKRQLVGSALTGLSEAELRNEGIAHARWILDRALRPTVMDRLQQHRDDGCTIVVVSASLRYYVEPVAAWLGVDEALCTELETDETSKITGRLLGPNCRGDEKVKRVTDRYGDVWSRATAYGDSQGDGPMLAAAAAAYRVSSRGRITEVTESPAQEPTPDSPRPGDPLGSCLVASRWWRRR